METPQPKNLTIGEMQAPQAPAPVTATVQPAVDAGGIVTVTDTRGRQIGLKKPGPVERFELDDAIATKTNQAALQVSIVGCVVSIDEDGMPPLWGYNNPRQAFLKRLTALGDEGLMAITPAALKMFGVELDDKTVQTAKNS